MTFHSDTSIVLSDEVRHALSERRGVVALESTIIVHGLPAPVNLDVARECELAVRAGGSVPATIALLNGRLCVGLSRDELEALADPDRVVAKLSTRDLGYAMAQGFDGATTVAATIAVAHRVGVSVMATGGLGGVHRGANESFDESADLTALSRTPVLVVASGAKSILDVGATLERLDTLGVPVWGYRTKKFPGFYLADSGFVVDWSIDSPVGAARAFRAHQSVSATGVLVAQPVSRERQLDPTLHDSSLEWALAAVAARGVTGKEVTPVLLDEFARHSAGASVQVNRDLVVANARLAGEIAQAFASGAA
ncbi:MAG TPA: pseudouridine-5'-phosphate glycosidase [Acidimicrobiales bacterium]|nr:pseudouridine-5'-phosphate glycosidase [Acidimicrobiales bacterium]